jgi:hypothetical protein
MEAKKLKTEIEKRTRDTSKLIELEAQKLAVGEMVLERLDSILELLDAAGFKVVKIVAQQNKTSPQPPPSNTVVVQASQLAPEQPPAAIKNPCSICGQEAAFDEPMPDGSKKFYCRPHGQQRMREKQEEAQTSALLNGNTGTMFARPKNPNASQPTKVIIQADPAPDPLKGPFPPNGGVRAPGPPPPNNVLGDD